MSDTKHQHHVVIFLLLLGTATLTSCSEPQPSSSNGTEQTTESDSVINNEQEAIDYLHELDAKPIKQQDAALRLLHATLEYLHAMNGVMSDEITSSGLEVYRDNFQTALTNAEPYLSAEDVDEIRQNLGDNVLVAYANAKSQDDDDTVQKLLKDFGKHAHYAKQFLFEAAGPPRAKQSESPTPREKASFAFRQYIGAMFVAHSNNNLARVDLKNQQPELDAALAEATISKDKAEEISELGEKFMAEYFRTSGEYVDGETMLLTQFTKNCLETIAFLENIQPGTQTAE